MDQNLARIFNNTSLHSYSGVCTYVRERERERERKRKSESVSGRKKELALNARRMK